MCRNVQGRRLPEKILPPSQLAASGLPESSPSLGFSFKSQHDTAKAAYVCHDHIGKAVAVKNASYYAVVVIPASNPLKMDRLRDELNRNLHFATDDDRAGPLKDYERGAVPPLGPASGI